ncbi:MAG: hypothetical protein ACJ8AT_19495 [Hyalangium sp.]|uniref:hypothetical protein n=1 Tax=Hyalangium sp. TaxID=2028555 RepID=UPI00389AC50E
MLRTIRLSLVAAAATALVACGGGAKIGGGKEGAAKAAFQAGQPAGKGANTSGQDLLRQMAAGAATGSAEFSADCAKGGSVKLKLDLTSTGSQDGSVKYKADYNNCNQDGINSYDGSMEIEFKIAGTATSLEMSLRLKGKVDISGTISDSIDADVTETFAATATSATAGMVTIKVDGSIKTSSASYTYANETLNITVDGGLPVDNSGKT